MTTELTLIANITALTSTTDAIVAEWLERERGEGASDNTLAAYERSLARFVAWVRDQGSSASSVAPQMIRAHKTHRLQACSPQTVNLQLAALRSFFRFLVNTVQMHSSPAASLSVSSC
jgi:site-specific recombinase XerD